MNINIDYCLQQPLRDWVLLVGLSLMMTYGTIEIFLAYRKLEAMEHRLNKCRFVEFQSAFGGSSLRGRLHRLSVVYITIAFPKRNARRGLIDVKQVQDFPKDMKYLLHFIAISGTLGFMGAIFFYLCDHLI